MGGARRRRVRGWAWGIVVGVVVGLGAVGEVEAEPAGGGQPAVGVLGVGKTPDLERRVMGVVVERLGAAGLRGVVTAEELPKLWEDKPARWVQRWREWLLDRVVEVEAERGGQGLITIRLALTVANDGAELERLVVQGDQGSFLWKTSLPRAVDRLAKRLAPATAGQGQGQGRGEGQGQQQGPSWPTRAALALSGSPHTLRLRVQAETGSEFVGLEPLVVPAPSTLRLPLGRYRIRAEAAGYRPQERVVDLQADRTEQCNLVYDQPKRPPRPPRPRRRKRRKPWKMLDIASLHLMVGTDVLSGHPLAFGHALSTPTMGSESVYWTTGRLGMLAELLGDPEETHWGPFISSVIGRRWTLSPRNEMRLGVGPAFMIMLAERELEGEEEGTDVRLVGFRPMALTELGWRGRLGKSRSAMVLLVTCETKITRAEGTWFVAPMLSLGFTFSD